MDNLELTLTSIKATDYMRLQALMAKGANIPLDGMDFADAFGILSLIYDLGVPLNKVYLGGGLRLVRTFVIFHQNCPITVIYPVRTIMGRS